MLLDHAVTAAAATLASGIIFPLYIYPVDGCSAWIPMEEAISAHPTLPFWIIVNPNSGPGDANTQPDTTYQTCTAQIKAYDNVEVLGYVRTNYSNRATADVIADIDTYSGWTSAYRPVGIFFDEAAYAASEEPTYAQYAAQVRTDFGSNSTVVLNPGTSTDSSYFSIADIIVTEEESYSDFSNNQLTISSAEPASQQAVILHDGPSTTDSTLVNELISTDGIKAIFMTDYADAVAYENIPTDWSNFVGDVQSAANA